MNPTQGDLHVNVPLTNVSIARLQSADDFVADKVFPVVPVQKQSDVYYEYSKADFFRNQMQKRAPGAESAGGAYRVSNTSYFANVFGLHKDVPDQTRANADSVFSLDRDATIFLTDQGLLSREITWASSYFTSSVWGTDITGVASAPGASQALQWNDAAATPIEDIRRGKRTIKQNSGLKANTLVLGEEVWDVIADHPDVLDRIKGNASSSSPAKVLKEAIAAILEIDRILVMGAVQNTAAEGAAASMAFIGGKKALLVHAAPNPGIMTASAGYTFLWNGYLGGQSPTRIKRFRMEQLESDRVEIAMAHDQKVVATDLGYYWGSIIA